MRPFEVVVREHGARVLRVCRAVAGPDDAEDAWSETFISALRAYPELPPDANVEAWLVTIAHRRSIDVVRSRQRQPLPVDASAAIPGSASASVFAGPAGRASHQRADHAPAHHEHDNHEYDDLYAAMRALPDKQRLTVAYHHLGGLPHREVAELLGGSEAAARRACADGLAALRTTKFWEELS